MRVLHTTRLAPSPLGFLCHPPPLPTPRPRQPFNIPSHPPANAPPTPQWSRRPRRPLPPVSPPRPLQRTRSRFNRLSVPSTSGSFGGSSVFPPPPKLMPPLHQSASPHRIHPPGDRRYSRLDRLRPLPPRTPSWVLGWEPVLHELIHRSIETIEPSASSLALTIDTMLMQVRHDLNQVQSGRGKWFPTAFLQDFTITSFLRLAKPLYIA